MKKIIVIMALVALISIPCFAWRRDGVSMPLLQNDAPFTARNGMITSDWDGGFRQPANPSSIIVFSTSTLDAVPTGTTEVTVWGSLAGVPTSETITLTGTTAATNNDHLFDTVFSITVAGDVHVGNIYTVYDDSVALVSVEFGIIPSGVMQLHNNVILDGTAGFGSGTGNFPVNCTITTEGWNRTQMFRNYYTDPFCLSDELQVISGRCSDVTAPITWSYQISDNNVDWIDGEVALTNLDNNITREVVTEPLVSYIRFVLSHSTVTAELAPLVDVRLIAK